MKIISPFRDYYDSIQAFGHDDSRVYVRETRRMSIPTNVWPYSGEILRRLESLPFAYYFAPGVLLFAGNAYPVWTESERWSDEDPFEDAVAKTHTPPGWERHFERLLALPLDDPERKRWKPAFEYFGDKNTHDAVCRKSMIKHQEQWAGERFGEDLLIAERAPAALVLGALIGGWQWELQRQVHVIVNPVLQNLDFHRLVDPFSAYQQIETFLGNQLAEADAAPLRVGSDEVIARQKGFDEISFRTAAPGAKKQHRKENRARKRG